MISKRNNINKIRDNLNIRLRFWKRKMLSALRSLQLTLYIWLMGNKLTHYHTIWYLSMPVWSLSQVQSKQLYDIWDLIQQSKKNNLSGMQSTKFSLKTKFTLMKRCLTCKSKNFENQIKNLSNIGTECKSLKLNVILCTKTMYWSMEIKVCRI